MSCRLLSVPVHVLCGEPKQPNQDAAAKLGIEFGLIINNMNEALNQVELHVEVGEICWDAAFQALQQCPNHKFRFRRKKKRQVYAGRRGLWRPWINQRGPGP